MPAKVPYWGMYYSDSLRFYLVGLILSSAAAPICGSIGIIVLILMCFARLAQELRILGIASLKRSKWLLMAFLAIVLADAYSTYFFSGADDLRYLSQYEVNPAVLGFIRAGIGSHWIGIFFPVFALSLLCSLVLNVYSFRGEDGQAVSSRMEYLDALDAYREAHVAKRLGYFLVPNKQGISIDPTHYNAVCFIFYLGRMMAWELFLVLSIAVAVNFLVRFHAPKYLYFLGIGVESLAIGWIGCEHLLIGLYLRVYNGKRSVKD